MRERIGYAFLLQRLELGRDSTMHLPRIADGTDVEAFEVSCDQRPYEDLPKRSKPSYGDDSR